MNKKGVSFNGVILALILLIPAILLIQKKAFDSPILFFLIGLGVLAWVTHK